MVTIFKKVRKWKNIVLSKHGTPPFLIFFVTSKCNLKCKHCFNWQKIDGQDPDLNLATIRRLTQELGPVHNLLLSGGEPYLRQDLPQIVELFCNNNHTRKISLPTNGYYPELIGKKTREILLRINNALLEIQLSLDGLENTHNEIRGKEDSFKNLTDSYTVLKALKKEFTNLRLNIAVTVTDRNIKELSKIKDFIQRDMKSIDNVFWGFWRGTARNKDVFLPDRRALENLFELNNSVQSGFVPSLLNDLLLRIKLKTLRDKKQVVDCVAGQLIGVIGNNGDIRLCELLESIGNITKNSFREIWHGEKADVLRKKIKDGKCYCSHECFIAPSVLYNPSNYFKIIPALACSLMQVCLDSGEKCTNGDMKK